MKRSSGAFLILLVTLSVLASACVVVPGRGGHPGRHRGWYKHGRR